MKTHTQVFLNILITVFLFAVGVTMIFPLIWMLSASFKFEVDVFNFPIEWIPKRWNMVANYSKVWFDNNFGLYYFNSIKISLLSTLFQVTVSAMGAYAFSKIKFKFNNTIFFIYLITLMIPFQVTIVPTFMIFRWIGLYNTHIGLIFLSSFSVYGMFLLKQFMTGISNEISEAAKIDGARHGKIFILIIVPMTKPAIATLALLKFIWEWNNYQAPLIFLSSRNLYTLQLFMKSFQDEYNQYYALIMTAAMLTVVPLIIVFLFTQKFVVEGISLGAVKG